MRKEGRHGEQPTAYRNSPSRWPAGRRAPGLRHTTAWSKKTHRPEPGRAEGESHGETMRTQPGSAVPLGKCYHIRLSWTACLTTCLMKARRTISGAAQGGPNCREEGKEIPPGLARKDKGPEAAQAVQAVQDKPGAAKASRKLEQVKTAKVSGMGRNNRLATRATLTTLA